MVAVVSLADKGGTLSPMGYLLYTRRRKSKGENRLGAVFRQSCLV